MARVRVAVVLEQDDAETLDRLARERGLSRSALIREQVLRLTRRGEAAGGASPPPEKDALLALLDWLDEQPDPGPAGDPLLALEGVLVDELATDVAEHHDTYLYGGEITA